MSQKVSSLKGGNELYGNLKNEEAFLLALEVYFIKMKCRKPPGKTGGLFI
ncbi:hypothetical protein ABR763_19845 [Bacillus cereus]